MRIFRELLLIVSLVFSHSGFTEKNVSYKKAAKELTIAVLNSEMKCVLGASVMVNNINATSQQLCYYTVPGEFSGFILVEIHKEGYEPYKEKVFVDNHEDRKTIYLIKKGEDYFYNGGVKEPYVVNTRLLLVSFRNSDGSKLLKKHLNKVGLKYIDYPDYLVGGKKYSDSNYAGPRNTLVVYRRDSSAFPRNNCRELKEIRNIVGVEYAGPFIGRPGNFYPPFTYSNSFRVKLAPEDVQMKTNYTRMLECLSAIGINETNVKHIYENEYQITCDASINEDVIKIMEQLKECSVVEKVSSDILLYTGID